MFFFNLDRTFFDPGFGSTDIFVEFSQNLENIQKFPDLYFNEIMDFLDIEPKKFHQLCENFRSPHLWGKVDSNWKILC